MFYDVHYVLVEYYKHIIKINKHAYGGIHVHNFFLTDGVYYKKMWRPRDQKRLGKTPYMVNRFICLS